MRIILDFCAYGSIADAIADDALRSLRFPEGNKKVDVTTILPRKSNSHSGSVKENSASPAEFSCR
jgi:hypothetical protein